MINDLAEVVALYYCRENVGCRIGFACLSHEKIRIPFVQNAGIVRCPIVRGRGRL